jgi:hypothetical protein
MVTEETVQRTEISPGRLWFGLVASVAAWVSLGVIDTLITWRSCVHQDQSGFASPHPAARALYIVVAIILFCTVLIAGTMSYGNWRALSQQREILQATATERREFMALLGIFVSITLGMGVLWLSIPPLWLEFCVRVK